jgi:hypothetical protein
VSWEIAPHFDLREGRFRHVGYDLTLYAKVPGTDPGSAEARAVHEALRDVASSVLPEGAGWVIEPHDASLHLRPETDWTPEVQLRARESEGETFDPVEPGEAKRAKAVGAALTRLGIPEGVYRKLAA